MGPLGKIVVVIGGIAALLVLALASATVHRRHDGRRFTPALASWQTIGGCGAGASSGSGAGIKWIGRNVSGGLLRVETQANYVAVDYGYNYVVTNQVSADVADRWNVAVAVPYVYKFMHNPYGLNFDVHNRGVGDVNALVTRRFGAIEATSLTLSLGLPTGKYRDHLVRDPNIILGQDRQLGAGRPSGGLVLDHTLDNQWGPSVVGGLVNWRGGTNDLGSYRAPSATLYGYACYLMGPFAPALGLQATGFTSADKDHQGAPQLTPLFSLAASASLEWSGDWVAVLLGASLPYQYDGETVLDGKPRSPWGFGPWMVALGVALAPF